MMQIIDIDDLLEVVKEISNTSSYTKLYWICEGRKIHFKQTKKELQQLVIEAQKMSKSEIRALIAIGLRNPARNEILSMLIQRELRDRAIVK